jgi:hypothetical protein
MSDQITLPPEFEFFRRVRPFTADEIASLTPLCQQYAAWKARHNIGQYSPPTLDMASAREVAAIFSALEQWGMQQTPPFILARPTMTEGRRQEVVAEFLRNAGVLDDRTAAERGRPALLVAPGAPLVPPPVPPDAGPQTTDTIPYTSPLSAPDLARFLRERGYAAATDDAVDSFLRRYRADYPDCYEERDRDDRRHNEPKYFYRPEVWSPLVQHFAPATDGG